MGFMLGSSCFRSKSPLRTSRIYSESLESLSILRDPSWAFESCKNIYY